MGAAEPRLMGGGERARRARARSLFRFPDLGARRRLLWLALQLLRPPSGSQGRAATAWPGRRRDRPRLRVKFARRAARHDFLYRKQLARPYQSGEFIGEHGSWDRNPLNGYKVVFVPFANGRPSGPPQDVVTGFLGKDDEARGCPVGLALDRAGALLVADDLGDTVWRVTAKSP
jgi:hypothetical protein